MKKFISCDWGTSALRLWLVDAGNLGSLAEVKSQNGISSTFDLWKISGKPEMERLSFYQAVVADRIKELEQQLKFSLHNCPIVISGMASSNIGMIELPYKELPLAIDGKDLIVKRIDADENFRHTIFLVSGARTNDDVMRGEETQLIGSIDKSLKGEQLFIFPGTHSKHIRVKDGLATDVKTFMTGELFELLSDKSILANDIERKIENTINDHDRESFKKGVAASVDPDLLHTLFSVRTNSLLGKLSKADNYYYLSGLLIGAELKGLKPLSLPVTVVGNEDIAKLYGIALQYFGFGDSKYADVAKSVVKGHFKILAHQPGF